MVAEDAMLQAEIGQAPPAGNSIFHVPEVAFDRGLAEVPVHIFAPEQSRAMARAATTGLVPLDLSGVLRLPFPATTSAMLARYVVVRTGDTLIHEFHASGEVYYVIRGEGTSQSAGTRVAWSAGDVFVLPGAARTTHRASLDSIMLCITNEPELALMDTCAPAAGDNKLVVPALFGSRITDEKLDLVHQRTGSQRTAGKSVIYVTPPFADTRTVLPTITASMNTLEPGGDQRPHLHNAAALTLAIEAEGVYSMVAGRKIDWLPFSLIVTPPRAIHSHHNRGPRMMKSFVVQDSGLYYRLRNAGFQWAD